MKNVIGNQFRKPSGIWGRIVSYLMKKGNRHAYDKLLPQLAIKPGDRVLEIGYGHGIGIDMLCREYDCSITGVDFSELMFREASVRNKRHCAAGKVVLHYGDYLDFNAEGSGFDRIFFINVIYFWNDLAVPFRKMLDELKPDGMAVFFMAHRDDLSKLMFTTGDVFNKYTIEQVTGALQKAGFSEVHHTFNNGYVVTAAKNHLPA